MSIHIQARTHSTDQAAATSPGGINAASVSQRPPLPIRLFYRARQFVRAVTAHVAADEMLVAAQILPKAALARFCQMPLDAQRHSFNVLYTLQEAGWDDIDLAAAALLHDVGKTASDNAGVRFNPWLRSILATLYGLLPEQTHRLATVNPAAGWRYLLHIYETHPQIGARWAAEAGCTELTCWLIEHHQDEPPTSIDSRREALLAMLQWADGRN